MKAIWLMRQLNFQFYKYIKVINIYINKYIKVTNIKCVHSIIT